MTLLKSEERKLSIQDFAMVVKMGKGYVKEIGEYCKWREVSMGKVQVKLTMYEASYMGKQMWFFTDNFNKICTAMQANKVELEQFIKDHKYVTVKEFYISNGMDEETWEEWNR